MALRGPAGAVTNPDGGILRVSTYLATQRPPMTMSHHAVLILFFTILGSCLGSFWGVRAYRIPRGLSVLRPRSRCPRCGAPILARDNVPVLGWTPLRGQCLACRCAISPRYAVVELAVGLLFVLPGRLAAAMAAGDPWERIGAGPFIGVLLASWTATGLGVFLVLLERDSRWQLLIRPSAAGPPGHRGSGGALEAPSPSVPAAGDSRGC